MQQRARTTRITPPFPLPKRPVSITAARSGIAEPIDEAKASKIIAGIRSLTGGEAEPTNDAPR